MAAAVVVGGVVGVVTSFGQGWVGETLNPVVNSVSAWVVAPFLIGVLARGRGVGPAAATLSASFLAEGGWVYGHVQDRWGSAALWCAIGVLVLAVEGRGSVARSAAWLTVVLPVAVAAFVAVARVHG